MAVAIAVAAISGPRLDAADTDLKVDYDKKFSFAGVKTWAWHPDGPGDVRLAITAEDDPKKVAARVDPIIIPSVEREMTARGLARTAGDADVYVHYYVLATVNQLSQIQGQFVPAVPDWGLPPFLTSTSALSVYPVGSLIIDVTSKADRAIVWRGAAERKIDVTKPDAERRKVLENAVRDLLKRFPPKK
jgi:hypothetical protein